MNNHSENSTEKIDRGLLVSVYRGPQDLEICKEHLDELELLCETRGLEVAEKVPCLLRRFDPGTFVTSGKLEELVQKANELDVNLIIMDDEISPAQQRNLEKAFQRTVMDRTELILQVFEDRAQTREAKLQVELAELKYEAPRLRRMWTHLSRQAGTIGGGGAYLKGAGETQIELDRRLIKNRIERLQKELVEVRGHRYTQRLSREKSGIPTFALVGYTNAGKSTLMNALTDAGVFVEDKLFATLDTTTRKYTLEGKQEALLTDTVGLIRKLPHHLVAAFKSTLEEAVQADILLHVVDVSHSYAEEHAEIAIKLIEELGGKDKPIITVLNKVDRCEDMGILNRLRIHYPHTVQISALQGTGLDDLSHEMVEQLRKQRKEVVLRIPQKEYHLVSEILRKGQIYHQDYDKNDVILKVDIPVNLVGKLNQYIVLE